MTDLAFIVDTSDAALPVGRAAASVPDELKGAESFSGMLGDRLQSDLVRRSKASDSSSPSVASNTNAVAKSGGTEPIDGKPLPLSPTQEAGPLPDSPQAGDANAALLAAISQSAARDLTGTSVASVVDSPATEVESDQDPSHPSVLPGSLLSGGLPNTLGEVTPIAGPDARVAQPKMAALPDGQLPATNLAKQWVPNKSGELPAEKHDARADGSRVPAASITSALLAQPIAESAQRALVMAMKDAGLGNRVAPSISGQAETSSTLSTRQTGLLPSANGLMMAMQLAAVSGRSVSNAGAEAVLGAAHQTQQSAPSLISTSPLAMTIGTNEVSGLLPAGSNLSTTIGTGFMPTMSVTTAVGQAGWANELGQRVAWLAQGDLREAQLQLHPRSLGPIEVRIAYGHEQQLNVSFTAANPLAREALDAALPRLREMFEQQGLNLADANISQHSFSDQRHQEGEDGKANSSLGNGSSDTEELTEQGMLSNRLLMGDGMLDAYA